MKSAATPKVKTKARPAVFAHAAQMPTPRRVGDTRPWTKKEMAIPHIGLGLGF